MWTGARTAVGVISELVDVHATFGGGVTAGDVVRNGGRGRFGALLEGDGAGYGGITAKDSDCVDRDISLGVDVFKIDIDHEGCRLLRIVRIVRRKAKPVDKDDCKALEVYLKQDFAGGDCEWPMPSRCSNLLKGRSAATRPMQDSLRVSGPSLPALTILTLCSWEDDYRILAGFSIDD